MTSVNEATDVPPTVREQVIGPPALSYLALFLRFLRFGALAFGGPVAQIAMVRQALVEDERWISNQRFNRLLAVLQVLPGPEAHELCVHLGMIALASVLATLAGVPFWIALAAGGGIHALAHRPLLAMGVAAAAGVLALAVTGLHPQPLSGAPSGLQQATVFGLFMAGLKGGLLTFGGAYTAIPYVRADTVGRGWISDATFPDGVALAGVLPAPLVIFATFAGYLAGGLHGALAFTCGMFLPAFAFSMIFFERLEAIVENPELHHLLEGVATAVVGIIAATLVQLALPTLARVPSLPLALVLFAVALAVVWRVKGGWVTPVVVVGGALAGWAVLS